MAAIRGRRAMVLAGVMSFTIGLVAVGGVAFAVIPDSGTGVIHSCYDTTTGALRVIDPSKGQSCGGSEAALNWNGRAMNWRGAWNATASYAIDDVVSQNGGTYLAKVANTNSRPPNANWATLGSPSYANVFSQSNETSSTYPIVFGANLTNLGQTGSVPAGNYTVSATVQLFMDNGAQGITCFLADTHGNFSNGYALTSGPPDPNTTGVVQTISLQDAFPESTSAKFNVQCAKSDGADPNASEAVSVSITATQVAHLILNGTSYTTP